MRSRTVDWQRIGIELNDMCPLGEPGDAKRGFHMIRKLAWAKWKCDRCGVQLYESQTRQQERYDQWWFEIALDSVG